MVEEEKRIKRQAGEEWFILNVCGDNGKSRGGFMGQGFGTGRGERGELGEREGSLLFSFFFQFLVLFILQYFLLFLRCPVEDRGL